jgi:DNA-binding GntR family transcriptional regulator
LTLHQTGETIALVKAPTPIEPRRRRHATMAEAAVDELQEAILSGELEPDAPLRLEELARSLGMSISPVREAVRQLEALGLAVHVPHRGARVSKLAIEDLHDTYEARIALETVAVRRAAQRFADEDTMLARDCLDEYVAAYERGDAGEARRSHTAFHFALYAASGSDWLVRLIRPAWENCERYRILSLRGRGTVPDRRREHERILDACVRHDSGAAARLLEQHLALTANLVARQMGSADLF